MDEHTLTRRIYHGRDACHGGFQSGPITRANETHPRTHPDA
jgi:hypothetical protein